MVLYIRRCFPFELNPQDQSQFHKTSATCPPPLQVQLFSLVETTMSGTSTTAFSDSAHLDLEQFLRSPDQNSRERLKNSKIILIKVYTLIYFVSKLLTYIRPCHPMFGVNL